MRTIFKGFDDDYVTSALLASAIIMIAIFVGLLGPMLVEDRVLDGHNVWLKPQKFAVSLFIHFMTLAIAAQLLTRTVRMSKILVGAAALAMIAHIFEFVWVVIQAGRARRSHFNFETNFEALMYAGMGIAVLFLVLIAFVIGWKIWRTVEIKSGLAWGFAIGLTLGTVVTLIMAGYMSSSNWRQVGTHPEGGAEIPFFGWSREVGDLRPAHFVALHMMQTLPIAGWIADRQNWPGKKIVIGLAIVQTLIATALFVQALYGKPFWPA